MDIDPIEAAIAAQLSGAFAGTTFKAQQAPDSDAEFQRAVPNPIAYVLYTGSYSSEQMSADAVIQRRCLKFNVECYSMKRKSADGLSSLRPLLESALIGYTPPNCEQMYLVKDELMRGDDSIWVHVYNLECFTMLVQSNYTEEIIVPSFQAVVESAT